MVREIVEVARCFAGRGLTEGEEKVLSLLCEASLESWQARLRPEVTPEQVRDRLVVASAWSALAGMAGALEQSSPTPLSFTAGDLTVRARETGDACARSLLRQAEVLMAPYAEDGGFGVWEVSG